MEILKINKQGLQKKNLATTYQTPGQLTTVMIRNIPFGYTQDDLMEEVSKSMGWNCPFDFFYLPWDMAKDANTGYAFVNFTDTSYALRAFQVFTNYKFKRYEPWKVAKVLPAHIQGLENNLRHLQDRAVVQDNHPCTPVVMWNGVMIELSKVYDQFCAQFGNAAVAPLSVPAGRLPSHLASVSRLSNNGTGVANGNNVSGCPFSPAGKDVPAFVNVEFPRRAVAPVSVPGRLPSHLASVARSASFPDGAPLVQAAPGLMSTGSGSISSYEGLPTTLLPAEMIDEVSDDDLFKDCPHFTKMSKDNIHDDMTLLDRHGFAQIKEDNVVEIALETTHDDVLLKFLGQFQD